MDEKFPDLEKLNILIMKYNIANSELTKSYLTLLLTAQKIMGKTESFLNQFNVTNTQLSIMLLLYVNETERETLSSISGKLGLSSPAISKVLNTLHKKDFIIKKENLNDRRCKYISLSKKGRNVLNTVIPEYCSKYEEFLSDFTLGELKKLRELDLKLFFKLDSF